MASYHSDELMLYPDIEVEYICISENELAKQNIKYSRDMEIFPCKYPIISDTDIPAVSLPAYVYDLGNTAPQ